MFCKKHECNFSRIGVTTFCYRCEGERGEAICVRARQGTPLPPLWFIYLWAPLSPDSDCGMPHIHLGPSTDLFMTEKEARAVTSEAGGQLYGFVAGCIGIKWGEVSGHPTETKTVVAVVIHKEEA